MSQNQQSSTSFSSTSFTSSSYTSSTSSDGHTTHTGHREARHASTDPSGGTTVWQATQDLGQPIMEQERRFDAEGREMIGGGDAGRARIEDVSEEGQQEERDRLYEERMEEEYAKREGGA